MANPEIVKKKEGQGHNRESETFCVRDMKIYWKKKTEQTCAPLLKLNVFCNLST